MRRNRMFIMLLVIVTVLAMATTALAGKPDKPDKPGKPPPPPEIWTCAERVENGAVWLPGTWNGTSYVSDVSNPEMQVDVDVPLCIDLDFDVAHKDVAHWTVTWEGIAGRKAPKGLMFIFEEEVHAAHYADLEMPLTAGDDITSGEELMILDFDEDDDDTVEHLVFLAMARQGDKWESIRFTVTPYPDQ